MLDLLQVVLRVVAMAMAAIIMCQSIKAAVKTPDMPNPQRARFISWGLVWAGVFLAEEYAIGRDIVWRVLVPFLAAGVIGLYGMYAYRPDAPRTLRR